jgi:hypothetical protein
MDSVLPIKSRGQFLQDSVLAGSTVLFLKGAEPRMLRIEVSSSASFQIRLAERELLRGLTQLHFPGEIRFATSGSLASGGELVFRLKMEPDRFKNPEAYSISANENEVLFSAASERGLLCSVFGFLEHQGAYFGIDGENYPPEAVGLLVLPQKNQPWKASPRFSVRGLLPWPDFLNCITVFNEEDFRAYFEAMLRMRFNMFGMHVYSSPESEFQGTESYLSFQYAGVSHLGYLDNSGSQRWGYLPERTSRYGMSGSQFFNGEVFGADATVLSRNVFEIADRTRSMLARALAYAKQLGLATGIGFEPYQVPEAILRALPSEIKPKPDKPFPGKASFDIESTVARRMLETRLGALLEAYPDVDYVWLWEDENMNWESRKTGVPLSVTPFQQAYDFLKRNASGKRMVLSGWGGVVRHFEYFHHRLPEDVIFSCLNDSLGWDPVNEVFGKLEDRERWPIPWLEDDPAMWLPQFHVNRTQRDVELAAKFGCQGMLGIHWRHRIMDPTAGYLAKATWEETLTPASHFEAYSKSQCSGDRAGRLAGILNDADLHQKVLHTGANQIEDGHVVTREWAADYDQGFLYWREYEPERDVVESQRQVAEALKQLAENATFPVERERVGYLSGFVNFAVPYTDAWTTAHLLNGILNEASKLKTNGHQAEAREKVSQEGVPLYLQLAPLVRETMLQYQDIVANRNDLGQLASMHNKFVRLALVRLRLSIEEFIEELPVEVQTAFDRAVAPDQNAQTRIFLPTRPGILRKAEKFRIMMIATGSAPIENVVLHTNSRGSPTWTQTPAELMERRTYEATVGPFELGQELVHYFVSASIGGEKHVAPSSAPRDSYLVTLV